MAHIKRKVTTDNRIVSVRVQDAQVEVEVFKHAGGASTSTTQQLTVDEAKQLRKVLKHAIVAAERSNNPF